MQTSIGVDSYQYLKPNKDVQQYIIKLWLHATDMCLVILWQWTEHKILMSTICEV